MRRNWGLKLFSLFLAFLLWFYAKTQMSYNIEIDVPVAYENLSQEIGFVETPDSSVGVQLTVRGGEILSLVFSKPRVVVDLSRVRLGRNTVALRDENLRLSGPRPIIRGFRPPELEFVLDRVIKKKLPVSPRIKGQPGEGYVLSGIKIMGSPVAEGPKSLVSEMKSLATEPINVEGKKAGFKARVRLISPYETVHLSPPELDVEVEVEPLVSKKMAVPVILVGKRARFSPGSLLVTVQGPRSAVEGFSGTTAVIKTDTLTPGTHLLVPGVRLPRDITVSKMEPGSVEVKIR